MLVKPSDSKPEYRICLIRLHALLPVDGGLRLVLEAIQQIDAAMTRNKSDPALMARVSVAANL